MTEEVHIPKVITPGSEVTKAQLREQLIRTLIWAARSRNPLDAPLDEAEAGKLLDCLAADPSSTKWFMVERAQGPIRRQVVRYAGMEVTP